MSDESSQVPPTFDQLVMPHQELDVEMVEVRARLNQGQKSLTNKTDESMEAARCSRAEPTFICTDKITHCFMQICMLASAGQYPSDPNTCLANLAPSRYSSERRRAWQSALLSHGRLETALVQQHLNCASK